MGDRRQAILEDNGNEIYIYVHSAGSDLEDIVRKAIREAWGRCDNDYCNRIIMHNIFEDVTSSKNHTGCGVSTNHIDSDYENDIYINVEKKLVSIGDQFWTFEKFTEKK